MTLNVDYAFIYTTPRSEVCSALLILGLNHLFDRLMKNHNLMMLYFVNIFIVWNNFCFYFVFNYCFIAKFDKKINYSELSSKKVPGSILLSKNEKGKAYYPGGRD